MSKPYVTKVEVDDEGNLALVFPDELLDELQLKDGDYLTWEVTTESVILRKFRKQD